MMKFGTHRFRVFKQIFVIMFFMLIIVVVIPETINYYIGWNPPAPDKEKLLNLLWITPMVSLLSATIAALITKEDRQEDQ
jgi:hypothetical protein